MRARFVYENVNFRRGKDPMVAMGIGDYWKRAVDILVEPLGEDVIVEWDLEDTTDPEGTPTKYLRTFVKVPGVSPVQLLLKWSELLRKPQFGGPPLGPKDKAFMLISDKMENEGNMVLDEDQLFYVPESDNFYRINVNNDSGLQKVKVAGRFRPPIEKYPGDDQGIVLDMAIWYQKD